MHSTGAVKMRNMRLFVFLFSMSLLQASTATTYTVSPDGYNYLTNTSLQYYVNNANEYFISHNKLNFLPGVHYLQSDLVIHNIANFTMTGNNSTIICSGSQLGLSITNVKGFALQKISLSQCGKDYSRILNQTLNIHSHHETILLYWTAALHIQQCTSVTMKNVSITVDTGINGLVAVNVMEMFTVTNLRVYANSLQFNESIAIHATNGIVLYFYDHISQVECWHCRFFMGTGQLHTCQRVLQHAVTKWQCWWCCSDAELIRSSSCTCSISIPDRRNVIVLSPT